MRSVTSVTIDTPAARIYEFARATERWPEILRATGAWEVATSALSLERQKMPCNVNFMAADDGLTVARTSTPAASTARMVLSNSSGFGGINAALVLRAV